MAGLDEFFNDVLVFAPTVGSRGRHHKPARGHARL